MPKSVIQKKCERKKKERVVLMLEKGRLKGKASFPQFPLVPFPPRSHLLDVHFCKFSL